MPILIALFLSFFTILGAEDDGATLPAGQTYEGDYFATGDHIQIQGVVTGDVYILGSLVIIGGRVEGDVIASGGTIELNGEVQGGARLASAQISLKGTIGKNCSAVGLNIQMTPTARIGGSGIFVGGQIDLSGDIQGGVRVTASNAQLLGKIERDVKLNVGQLQIGPDAELNGNVEYSSGNEAVIDPSARIQGNIIYQPSALQEFFAGKWRERLILGSKLIALLMNFFYSFVSGLLFLKMFPEDLNASLNALEDHRWKSMGIGLLVLILLPLVFLILLITIIGFPIALALLALSVLTFYSAKVIPIIWISNTIFPKMGLRQNSVFGLFLGLVLFFIALQIPFIGWLISLIFILLGLGAMVLGRIPKKASHMRKVG